MSFADHVHPHGPITEVVPGIWQVTGSLPRSPLPRNMAIVPIEGGLLLHSVVALDPGTMDELEALGTPKVMVVPSAFHRSDAAVYKERYPEILVVAPKAAISQVEQVVKVDESAQNVLPNLGIQIIDPPGCKAGELIYEVDVEGGRALILCDMLFNIQEHQPGCLGLVFRYITRSSGFFGITGLGRVLMLKDAGMLKAWLEQQAARDDLKAILVGHGDAIVNCREMLESAQARL